MVYFGQQLNKLTLVYALQKSGDHNPYEFMKEFLEEQGIARKSTSAVKRIYERNASKKEDIIKILEGIEEQLQLQHNLLFNAVTRKLSLPPIEKLPPIKIKNLKEIIELLDLD